ncbi:class I SAM-dependent methyltransferase [Brevibacillus sp. NPDC058079]|uniref:class I SAM-dependent methyltransferase n=1 Tax=Brevibacillus sp. NPDC058079 TaxID=3346330 RepID=UPI0036E9C986
MAIVQLTSTNPDFSFIIRKNPATGMILKEIRKGIGHGWYSNPGSYSVYFKDADNDVSYQREKDEFEYLNTSRYRSPLAILNIVNEFFDTPLKKQSDQDIDGYENEIYIPLVNVEHVRYIRFFQDNFPEFHLEAIEKANKSYSLFIKTRKSIHELLNYVSLLSLFLAIFASEYLDVNDSIIKKYLTVINRLDAPFFIRYLFGRNVLVDRGRFKKYKQDLESTNRNQINLEFGNTAIQRRDKIKSLLNFDKSILDIGCGEGFYAMPFAKNLGEYFYYAIDVNEEMVAIVEQKVRKAEMENVITFGSIDAFLESYNEEKVDIILTEVVEHMEVQESSALLTQIIENVDFDQLIVTTPNSEFNQFYALEGFRHDDHKWEMTTTEFQTWIKKLCGTSVTCEFFGIGDSVDGIQTTQGVIIQKQNKESMVTC